MFFFEKKNQKTFAYRCVARRQRTPWSIPPATTRGVICIKAIGSF
jgi:hypothetical protein